MAFEPGDIVSGVLGIIIFLSGVLLLLESLAVFSLGLSQANWFIVILPYLLAALGLYLGAESFIELSNAQWVGWFSLTVGVAILGVGVLEALRSFGIAIIVLPSIVFPVIFIIEGIFLIIAMYATRL